MVCSRHTTTFILYISKSIAYKGTNTCWDSNRPKGGPNLVPRNLKSFWVLYSKSLKGPCSPVPKFIIIHSSHNLYFIQYQTLSHDKSCQVLCVSSAPLCTVRRLRYLETSQLNFFVDATIVRTSRGSNTIARKRDRLLVWLLATSFTKTPDIYRKDLEQSRKNTHLANSAWTDKNKNLRHGRN